MARLFRIFWRLLLLAVAAVLTLGVSAYLFPRTVLTVESGGVKADALVVLGGGDGRAERAAELFRQGAAPLVVVTGYGDCASNVETLERNGVPKTAITAEPRALTTRENAELSLPILRRLGAHRVIIVTSWFHSRRAVACFEHFAPDLTFYSRPSYLDYDPGHRNRSSYNLHVNYEFVKLLGYWFAYGICPL